MMRLVNWRMGVIQAVVMVGVSAGSVQAQAATPQPVEVVNWPTPFPTATITPTSAPTETPTATPTSTPLAITPEANGCLNPGPTPAAWDSASVTQQNSYRACTIADAQGRAVSVGTFFLPLILVSIIGGFTLAKKQ